MKKLSILLPVIMISFGCNQHSKHREAPDDIVAAFKKHHPNATILKWNDESPVWEAKYTDEKEKGAVTYDKDANIIETELVIEESELPHQPAIPEYIKTKYPGEKIQSCEKVEKKDGTITYEIQITGKEIVFDAAGKYLDEEPD